MPHNFALAFGRFAGKILRLILWRKTDKCESRCVKSLGVGVTISRGIIRDSFANLGMSVAEFIRLPKVISHIDELVDFPEDSINVLRSALSRGNGAILMCQHFANWEYAAARVIHEGFKLHAVYTPQRDKSAESIIMSTRRNISHMAMIDSNTGLREVFRVLKPEGTLWLNIGDTYNGYKGNANQKSFESMYAGHRHQPARKPNHGLEAKSLKSN